MKVTAGLKKGQILKVSKRGIRPTRGIIRQAIFNIIGERIQDALVLDLFAGTGAFGIEALSRGARDCIFIDKEPAIIIKNIQRLKLQTCSRIIAKDFRPALKKLKNNEFDIIFIDPPYNTDYLPTALKLIQNLRLLKDNGIIITERRAGIIYKIPENYRIVKEKKYGDTEVDFIEKVF
uniref:16S rRNA (Guanine(966)-N(2))-methyltransferase RsmD n=1 Tax=candidate division WOR-3 bacterium TaxID=2052148 RepID=A0A7C4TAZ7_UNCW3